jgi:hypothetical protein
MILTRLRTHSSRSCLPPLRSSASASFRIERPHKGCLQPPSLLIVRRISRDRTLTGPDISCSHAYPRISGPGGVGLTTPLLHNQSDSDGDAALRLKLNPKFLKCQGYPALALGTRNTKLDGPKEGAGRATWTLHKGVSDVSGSKAEPGILRSLGAPTALALVPAVELFSRNSVRFWYLAKPPKWRRLSKAQKGWTRRSIQPTLAREPVTTRWPRGPLPAPGIASCAAPASAPGGPGDFPTSPRSSPCSHAVGSAF